MVRPPAPLPSAQTISSTREAVFLAVDKVCKSHGVFGEADLKAFGAFFRAIGVQRAILRFDGGGDVEAFRGIDIYADPIPEHPEFVAALVGDLSHYIGEAGLTLNKVVQASSPTVHLSVVAGGAIVFDVDAQGFEGQTALEVTVQHRRTSGC